MFDRGKLQGVKLCRNWRGARTSQAYHEKYPGGLCKIIPVEALLAINGLNAPSTQLTDSDMAILKSMGIS
jgi:hypothetical protein